MRVKEHTEVGLRKAIAVALTQPSPPGGHTDETRITFNYRSFKFLSGMETTWCFIDLATGSELVNEASAEDGFRLISVRAGYRFETSNSTPRWLGEIPTIDQLGMEASTPGRGLYHGPNDTQWWNWKTIYVGTDTILKALPKLGYRLKSRRCDTGQ